MIAALIRWSIHNRVLVLLGTLILLGWGLFALRQTPVDAIPDLSDVQVIVKTSFPGQAPQVVEDQVTYPLTTALLAVPGATTVRGYSFFGDSYVYVIFDEGTDLYWARARVLEYLSQVSAQLPPTARPQLGPDATGVGWVYLYALIDRSGRHDLSQLRSLQDWFLKFELQSVPGVAEVATAGGMVRQYQVTVDPERLRALNMPLAHVRTAIERANQEVGASVIEMAEAEYMVRSSGYLQGLEDLQSVPLGVSALGTPLLLKDVAEIGVGPQMRRGVTDLDGEGEAVGGIVVMRYGENALQTIQAVRERLDELRRGLPEGVEIVTVYDRSGLIERAIDNLWHKLIEELLVVAVVCAAFLFHLRSSLVAVISLPIGILVAFIVMHLQGVNANIMSLGGIAIAIGAMIDGAIVMVENLHKHLERPGASERERWQVVAEATTEVGPALFFSLLIITVSFIPVFTLEAQEGRLFAPLAYTKTYAMAAAAALAVTLVPVLMGWFIRGRILPEDRNPLNRWLKSLYLPPLRWVLGHPRLTLSFTLLVLLVGLLPLRHIGSEFFPPLDEGDLMYMPTTHPGISVGKARELLQQTDRLIRTVPEVERVFGKVGRAETATDPAPLTMIETFVQLRPRSQWRDGMTTEKLIEELQQRVDLPGVTNAWVMPIKTRIDMLATGIKTPVGIKIGGPELAQIDAIGRQIEEILADLPGTASVYAERVAGGRYLQIDVRRDQAARHGMNVADVQMLIASAVGGVNLGQSVEGRERYPINLRYPQGYRDSPEQLALLPIVTPAGQRVVLSDLASIRIEDGPPSIKTENARPNGWIYIDISGIDVGHYVEQAQAALNDALVLPAGYSISWSGQYEYMQRAKARLAYVIPLTLAIIVVLLYLNFRTLTETAIVMLSIPFALIGGIALIAWLGNPFSVAVIVGFIALAGVAAETGVVMLLFLQQAWQARQATLQDEDRVADREDLRLAVIHGAVERVRPKLMTVATVIAGLLPIMWGTGTGSEVMRRIATPMVGGMLSSTVLTLIVIPVLYFSLHARGLPDRRD
ncbi:MAG: efflux RND transporter permease subunit [Lysobacterales bacterium]